MPIPALRAGHPTQPVSTLTCIVTHILHIHTWELDTGCPSLEDCGWWVEDLLYPDNSPTHPVPQTSMHNDLQLMYFTSHTFCTSALSLVSLSLLGKY